MEERKERKERSERVETKVSSNLGTSKFEGRLRSQGLVRTISCLCKNAKISSLYEIPYSNHECNKMTLKM